MRLFSKIYLVGAAFCGFLCAEGATAPVDYVSTLVGTMSTGDFSAGNTYPAIAMPWGMNFWTPQTGTMGDGWQYSYTDRRIRGFKQTHQPSPWINDYGQFAMMPVSGKPCFDQESRASWFTHKSETATPYYYKVYLADHDVTAEITPTERAAIHRYRFHGAEPAFVVVDAFDNGSHLSLSDDSLTVTGYTTKNSGGVPEGFANWFTITFDAPVKSFSLSADGGTTVVDSSGVTGNHAVGVFGFGSGARTVTARVASSFISPEQSLLNMREVAGRSFEEVKAAGRDRWNSLLGRIELGEDEDIDRKRTFYSCLYRALLFPRALYEYDSFGMPVHRSPYNGEVAKGYIYTDTGFWDTFRSLFPLLNLLYPSENQKIQSGLANAYRESGFLPEWASPGHRGCMVGNNSASVVADAILRGVTAEADAEILWEAVTHGANAVHPDVNSTGRLGYDYYNKLGYVPCDAGINESAARTLEYAYDDWCIYTLGKYLKRPKRELEPYRKRALNYKKLFDGKSGLMRGRKADGKFASPFNPLKWGGDFTEGNSWHYTWSVFHDPAGLISLMGGKERFNAMLDSVFEVRPLFDESYYGFVIHEIREMQVADMGNYAHGNQPAQHMIYLYNYSGEPWKAQQRVRDVMTKLYSATPDGYCGDEDNGQTSAWYIFSALGFYPVCPGSGEYIFGAPLFKKATLRFEDGKSLEISAPDNSDESRYIERMSLNNRVVTANYITHSQLRNGGKLKLRMTDTPVKSRGTAPSDAPYSFSN